MYIIVFSLVLSILVLGACSSHQSEVEPEICPVEAPTVDASLVKADNLPEDWKFTTSISFDREDQKSLNGFETFGCNLIKAAAEASEDGAFCISPVSISLYLGMTSNALAGQTRTEILQALGADKTEPLNSLCGKLMHYLPCEDAGSCLAINNNFWVSNEYAVPKDFEKLMGEVFYAGVSHVDFSNPSTVPSINQWVSEHTNGLIPSILDNDWTYYIGTPMVNANTVYFKGNWEIQFNASATKRETFHGQKGTSTVDMMHQRLWAVYCSNDKVEKIILPFEDPFNEMELYLPAKGVKISDILDVLAGEERSQLGKTWEKCDVTLSLPKFESETNMRLKEILGKTGITSLDAVDFSPMGIGVYRLNILHKTSVKVDEKGAEMAAVTAGDLDTCMPQEPERKIILEFNRPFLFVVRNRVTDVILMAGTVVDF